MDTVAAGLATAEPSTEPLADTVSPPQSGILLSISLCLWDITCCLIQHLFIFLQMLSL